MSNSLPEECPPTKEHIQMHLDSLIECLAEDDFEQVAHDADIIMQIADILAFEIHRGLA